MRKYSEELVQKAITLYLEGNSLEKTAEALSISPSTVYLWMRQEGIPVRAYGGPRTAKRDNEIREKYEAGSTTSELAEEYNINRWTVTRAVNRAGGTVRKGRDRNKFTGNTYVNTGGYVVEKVRPDWEFYSQMAKSRGRTGITKLVLQHRKVMADHLRRPLKSNESVHHINGIKTDNRLENLQIRRGHHGPGINYVCRNCGSQDVKAKPL